MRRQQNSFLKQIFFLHVGPSQCYIYMLGDSQQKQACLSELGRTWYSLRSTCRVQQTKTYCMFCLLKFGSESESLLGTGRMAPALCAQGDDCYPGGFFFPDCLKARRQDKQLEPLLATLLTAHGNSTFAQAAGWQEHNESSAYA